MQRTRSRVRTVLWLLANMALCCETQGVAAQEQYPSRSIEMVIAFPPGGITDLWARILGDEMAKTLKVPIVPVNKGGGSGTLGAMAVLNAPRDGYTLLANTFAGMVLAPTILKDVTFDTTKDFMPIAFIATLPDALVVKADSPFRTIQDLLEAARRNPGKISYGSVGTGSVGHFNGEILSGKNDIKLRHVPFKGGGELNPAVLGGHIDFALGAPGPFMPLEQAGKLRFLGVTGKARMSSLSKIPTFGELSLKGDFMDNWAGLFAPAGIPIAAVDLLRSSADRVLKSPEIVARIEKSGGLARYASASEFQATIQREKLMAVEVAKKAGL
jgi:tripartite-type tricarboxylate transporter receptor subunit TctC